MFYAFSFKYVINDENPMAFPAAARGILEGKGSPYGDEEAGEKVTMLPLLSLVHKIEVPAPSCTLRSILLLT